MYRSFTDRVFAGLCGGLGSALGLNAWWLRATFIILTLVSLGAFGILYVLLWWALPQESLMDTRSHGLSMIWVLLLTILVIIAWAGREMGWLQGPTGINLYWP